MVFNRKFRTLFTLLLAFALLVTLGMFNSAQAETYKIKFQMAWHTQHPEYAAYKELVKRLKDATDGKIKLTIFPGEPVDRHQ